MTPRWFLGPALALLLGAALLTPTASASGTDADPPRIDRLTGRVLHTASGDTVPIPVAKRRQNSLELLGQVRQGWLVAHHWDARMLIVSPEGDLVRSFSYAVHEEYPGNGTLTLSARGDRVLVLANDRGDQTVVTVLDLHGREVRDRRFASQATVLATRGRTFYLRLEPIGPPDDGRLVAWRPGSAPRELVDATVDALTLRHELVVRAATDGDRALAPLRRPEELRWTTSGRPWADYGFAPDGRHVAAAWGARRVAVLDASDGSVATRWRFGHEHYGSPVWEDRAHLLVEVTRGQEHTLLRCAVGGSCERTVPWQAHPLLGWDYTVTR